MPMGCKAHFAQGNPAELEGALKKTFYVTLSASWVKSGAQKL